MIDSPETADEPRAYRVTMNFPPKVWKALERMATMRELNRTEAVRRSISTEVFRTEMEEAGAVFLIQWPNGDMERVRFPY